MRLVGAESRKKSSADLYQRGATPPGFSMVNSTSVESKNQGAV